MNNSGIAVLIASLIVLVSSCSAGVYTFCEELNCCTGIRERTTNGPSRSGYA
jgi:hypothetical protein